MGMMNNCCYRVKIHPRQGQGERRRSWWLCSHGRLMAGLQDRTA